MNLLEAAKQALDAMEDVQEMMNTSEWFNDRVKALRQAIEQSEKQKPVAYLQIGVSVLHEGVEIVRKDMPKVWNKDWWRFEPLYTAPPQDEMVSKLFEENQRLLAELSQAKKQRPVGWWNGRETAWFEHESGGSVDDCTIPLYTTPPQREWVGLRRNEAMEIINLLVGQDWMYAVDAVEAKLKEKNK